MGIDLPDWARKIHANERSQRLYPFAFRERSNELRSYTYPKDYGSKANSVGLIGDASLAGITDTSYGVILSPNLPLYMLSDADIALLLRWFPGGWNATKLRGTLLTEFNRTAAELPLLDWPSILAMLASRNPPRDQIDDPIELAKRRLFQEMANEDESTPAAATPAQVATHLEKIAADWTNGVQTERAPDLRAGICIKRALKAGAFSSPIWTGLAIELNGLRDFGEIFGKTQAWFAKQSVLTIEQPTNPGVLTRLAAAIEAFAANANKGPAKQPGPQDVDDASRIIYAVKLKSKNPNLSVREAAKQAGLTNHSTLFRSPEWKVICSISKPNQPPRGAKSKDGHIDAVDDYDDFAAIDDKIDSESKK